MGRGTTQKKINQLLNNQQKMKQKPNSRNKEGESTDRSLGEKNNKNLGDCSERVDKEAQEIFALTKTEAQEYLLTLQMRKSRDVKKDAQPKRNTRNNRGEWGVDYAPTSPKARF